MLIYDNYVAFIAIRAYENVSKLAAIARGATVCPVESSRKNLAAPAPHHLQDVNGLGIRDGSSDLSKAIRYLRKNLSKNAAAAGILACLGGRRCGDGKGVRVDVSSKGGSSSR